MLTALKAFQRLSARVLIVQSSSTSCSHGHMNYNDDFLKEIYKHYIMFPVCSQHQLETLTLTDKDSATGANTVSTLFKMYLLHIVEVNQYSRGLYPTVIKLDQKF